MTQDVDVAQMLRAWAEAMRVHDDHEKQQIGRCVYCKPCGLRLYQGTLAAEV